MVPKLFVLFPRQGQFSTRLFRCPPPLHILGSLASTHRWLANGSRRGSDIGVQSFSHSRLLRSTILGCLCLAYTEVALLVRIYPKIFAKSLKSHCRIAKPYGYLVESAEILPPFPRLADAGFLLRGTAAPGPKGATRLLCVQAQVPVQTARSSSLWFCLLHVLPMSTLCSACIACAWQALCGKNPPQVARLIWKFVVYKQSILKDLKKS